MESRTTHRPVFNEGAVHSTSPSRFGVPELAELAATVALAGTEGAKVRASLSAKAVSLRVHELTEAETSAQAATERMSLPVVLLFAGFLIFVGYPAVEHVLTGL